jgi:hypothetical protein
VPPEVAARRKRQKAAPAQNKPAARDVGTLEQGGWYRVRKSLPGATAIVADEAALLGEKGWRVEDVPVVDLTAGLTRGRAARR